MLHGMHARHGAEEGQQGGVFSCIIIMGNRARVDSSIMKYRVGIQQTEVA